MTNARFFQALRCIAQRSHSASGAIDLGELSDIPRDEDIGTGVLLIYA
jgi:hypothetical protein